jgi:hypothetical protein
VIEADGLRALLEQEKERALRLLTSATGLVQPRIVAATQKLIEEEEQAGRFVPAIAPALLAYGLVRLGEAFLYNDAIIGLRGNTDHLKEMDAVLLGLRNGEAKASAPTQVTPSPALPKAPSATVKRQARADSVKTARTAAGKAGRVSTRKIAHSAARKSSGARSR